MRRQAASTGSSSAGGPTNATWASGGSNTPRRNRPRINSDQSINGSNQAAWVLRCTSHTASGGFSNNRAKATTTKVTTPVINTRCSTAARGNRRQRSTV